MKTYLLALLLLVVPTIMVQAGEADVIKVEVAALDDGTYRFDITVRHSDEGWDHYAEKWEILDLAGSVLGTRTLYHPHVDDQPFYRSLSGVKISDGITKVTIRAHDSVHEIGGKTVMVELPR